MEACGNLAPRHNASSSGQPSPYSISLNVPRQKYQPGQTYSLTIQNQFDESQDFRGFMCQIRELGASQPLGQFSLVENGSTQCDDCKGRIMTCNSSGPGLDTVTHSNNLTISNYTVKWTAPTKGLGKNIQLHALCTIVQSKTEFWDNVESLTRITEDVKVTTISTLDISTTSTTSTTGNSILSEKPTRKDAASVISLHYLLMIITVIVHCLLD